jgi:hypothetical protein
MRILEIIQLNEASVFSKPVGYTLLVGDSKGGQKLKSVAAEIGIDLSGEIKVAAGKNKIEGRTLTVGKGADIINMIDSKNNMFTIVGSKDAIEPKFVNPTANRGEIAEGILGAAMFAKFTARESGDGIGQVTTSDVWRVIYNLKQTNTDEYSTEVKDSNSKIADHITFVLKLKSAPFAAVTDPKQQPDFQEMVDSATSYINSSHATRYSKYFYVNGKADVIKVVSDGVTSEAERKTDVELEILDHKTKQMKRGKLAISLKYGPVKQFGQVGGTKFKSMKELWGQFGINIDNLESHYTELHDESPEKALRAMYAKIAEYIAMQVEGDDDAREYDLINNVANAINYFATKNDPSVSLVQFTMGGGFKVLRFNTLASKLKEIDLTATYNDANVLPEIYIYDANNRKNVLIKIRAKNEFKTDKKTGEKVSYVRNLIEKGPLLDIVASSSK